MASHKIWKILIFSSPPKVFFFASTFDFSFPVTHFLMLKQSHKLFFLSQIVNLRILFIFIWNLYDSISHSSLSLNWVERQILMKNYAENFAGNFQRLSENFCSFDAFGKNIFAARVNFFVWINKTKKIFIAYFVRVVEEAIYGVEWKAHW